MAAGEGSVGREDWRRAKAPESGEWRRCGAEAKQIVAAVEERGANPCGCRYRSRREEPATSLGGESGPTRIKFY
jgi:hypothetical protein